MPIAPVFPGPDSGGGGGGTVTAPSPTSQSVAAGGSLSAKTFGAFTDSGGLIDNYVAAVTNAAGSAAVSGSGLGAYTFGSTANGDSGTLSLTARDASNNPLATATHSFKIAAGTSAWSSVLDWSSASEAFGSGEGTYTIGGLSVTLDYESGSGPASLSLSSGVLSVQADDSDYAYLIIDLGADFSNVPLWACCSITSVSNVGSTSAVIWQLADDTTRLNAAGHWQELIGQGGSATTILGRFATGSSSFVNANNRTVTNITSTPTRVAVYIDGTDFRPSFDQGNSALPTNGDDLSTVGPSSYSSTSGSYTTTNARNQRYMHLRVRCTATIRVSAAKRS